MISLIKKNILYLAWVQALVAMLGSLYFSDVLHWKPCTLCWYQRILMYPLVLIIAVGILKKDRLLPFYVLPLSIIGFGIALFHYLLQRGLIVENLAPCSLGTSCAKITSMWFGFITIPLLSVVAFGVITICMIVFLKSQKQKK